jgi:hypothetical protein
MKDWWKIIVRMAVPLIRAAGEAKKNEDENNTGQDDAIGVSLVYAADLLDALLTGGSNLPKAPAILAK